MPKKRKTRKEKMHLDQKRHLTPQDASPTAPEPHKEAQQEKTETAGMTFSLPATQDKTSSALQKVQTTKVQTTTETISVSTNEYAYLSNDLMRTALLTGAIVLTELLIRLFFVH